MITYYFSPDPGCSCHFGSYTIQPTIGTVQTITFQDYTCPKHAGATAPVGGTL